MASADRPNLLFVFADQLRAASVPLYGGRSIRMPNLDALARGGVTFTQAISTCPLCTPYRAMLLTGRHPQTTGMIMNWLQIRSAEISIGDAFAQAGYRTGWVGKWHLASGDFPAYDRGGPEYIPEGRDRLGFEYFRAYNYRTRYFDGWVCLDDWRVEQWQGYETDGLCKYAFEFLQRDDHRPFCLFVSPHQPHHTAFSPAAPSPYYRRVAAHLDLPPNVPAEHGDAVRAMLRDYLAMTAALDDMLGRLLEQLDRMGRAHDTLVVFTSDHGTMGGAHGLHPWLKKKPYDEAVRVPLVARLPDVLRPGACCDALVAPVDLFPTLCGLCDVPIPRSVEGLDLAAAWRGEPDVSGHNALLTADFTTHPDFAHIQPGDSRERPHYTPWRAVRTRTHNYVRWLDGQVELYDLSADPLEMRDLADEPASAELRQDMETQLQRLLDRRQDRFEPSARYAGWFDHRRRVVRNAFGPLSDPESAPDWSLLSR